MATVLPRGVGWRQQTRDSALFAERFNDVKPGSVNGGDRYHDSIRISLILPGIVAFEMPYRPQEMDLDYTKYEQPAGGATGGRAA